MSVIDPKAENKDKPTIQYEEVLIEESFISGLIKKIPYQIQILLPPMLFFIVFLAAIFLLSCVLGVEISVSLGTIGSVVSIFTAILAFLTWFNVQKLQSARPKKPAKAGNMSAILIVDVGGNGIFGNVINYCKKDDSMVDILEGVGFKNPKLFIDINERIADTGYKISIIKPENSNQDKRILNVTISIIEKIEYGTEMEATLNDPARQLYKVFGLIDKALHENGISELHVFYRGPLFIPFFLAELLSNQYKVYIYQYLLPSNKDNPGTYEFMGVMNHLLYH